MAQRDIINTLKSYERAREKEEASRTRRRDDLARRHEQARAQLYLIEEEFIQEGYDLPGTAVDEVLFENNNNNNIDEHADRGDLDAAVDLNDDPGDAVNSTIARREEMLRGVPVGGIAGVPVHGIARGVPRVGHGGGGAGRLRGENTGRGNAGAYGGYGGRAVGVNSGQMPVDDPDRFRYWRKQYFKSILTNSGGDGEPRRQGRGGTRGRRGGRGGQGGYNGGRNVFYF